LDRVIRRSFLKRLALLPLAAAATAAPLMQGIWGETKNKGRIKS
jgi:hypothetical protein